MRGIKAAFHKTDTDTDSPAARHAYILTSDTCDFLARMSVSVSMSHSTTPTPVREKP